MSIYEYKMDVRFLDVGSDNLLTPKGFIQYMQEAACNHSDSLGYGLTDTQEMNLSWVISNWKLKIISRPKCGTNILIKTWARSLVRFYSYRDFEVYDQSGSLIAIATSKWILLDTKNKCITRIPDYMVEAYSPTDICVFNEPFDEKPSGKLSDICYEYTIQRRDIDTNHHVNNLYYLDFAIDTLPEDVYESLYYDNIEVLYKKQILYKDKIKCFYSYENGKHIVTIMNESLDVTHAVVCFY